MKRAGAVLLVSALLPALVGCHRAEQQRKLIAIIIPSQDNPYFKAEGDAAAARAQALGYRTRVDSHEDDAYRQDNLMDAAIASNAAALILDNAGSEASIAAVRRATHAGIAVFLIDREINATGLAKAQIIADNYQGAMIVAKEFARSVNYSGKYAELLGRESDTNAQIRTSGFHAVLDKYPALERVSAQSANWSQSEAFQKTETMLQAHSDIVGVIAGNDTMALGAVAAAKSAGQSRISITGFDGSPDAVNAIHTGALRATTLQPAVVIAQLAVDEAAAFLRTGSTGKPEKQVIPCDLVTQTNAKDYRDFEKIR
ncbi:MAG TPA: D-ribose ABC transporter substrate-binding protein [Acidobacteriaceae bacterium]|nr:D-ribose ABC transporter substrate-binding protein [Acidobacteriaceae bacterium]